MPNLPPRIADPRPQAPTARAPERVQPASPPRVLEPAPAVPSASPPPEARPLPSTPPGDAKPAAHKKQPKKRKKSTGKDNWLVVKDPSTLPQTPPPPK